MESTVFTSIFLIADNVESFFTLLGPLHILFEEICLLNSLPIFKKVFISLAVPILSYGSWDL